MNSTALCLTVALLAAPAMVAAQSPSFSSSQAIAEPPAEGGGAQAAASVKYPASSAAPFSRLALGGGLSTAGINLLVATNVTRYMNLRGTGNVFNYTANNITTNGFNVDANLSFASAGVSADFYPLSGWGWRVSPGLLFYNQNSASAKVTVATGNSFTLDNQTYYSSSTNPVLGTGSLGLHSLNPAFTLTTGWGNVIPGKGKHWSFPFEIGVAFVGAPTVNVNLTGSACLDKAQTECADLTSTTNPISIQVQSNLTAQKAKWVSDLDPLKTYPIVSAGVAYSFNIR